MNRKKIVTLLVLTTMLFAMVPIANALIELTDTNMSLWNDDSDVEYHENFPADGDAALADAQGEKGDEIWIEGDEDSVSSGYDVSLYWDKVQSWDGEKGLLNTTEADDDGGYEIWFDVPEADEGEHQLWFTATDQEGTLRITFTVIPDCDISSSSGLAGSKILVDLWGFDDNEDVAIVFSEDADPTDWGSIFADNEVIYTFTAANVTADVTSWTNLQLRYYPVAPTVTDLAIIHNDGTPETIATFDGAWTTVVAATFESAALDEANGQLDLTVDSSILAAGDTIEVDYTATDLDSVVTNEDQDESADDEDDEYDGVTENGIIIPGTFHLQFGAGGADIADDDGGHDLVDANGGDAYDVVDGSIDYVTGEWSIEFADAPGDLDFYSDYTYVETITNYVDVLTTTGTNDVGSLEDRRVTIPTDTDVGDYWIVGFDGDGNDAADDFEIGAVITLSTDEGDVGDVINVEGEGFTPGGAILVELVQGGDTWVCHIIDADDGDDEVENDGEFDIDIVIPKADDEDDDYDIRVTVGADSPDADFEITGLAEVIVEPDFGPQGSTITVSGTNFPNINDIEILLELYDDDETTRIVEISDDAETDSDGSFEIEVKVPTENDGPYTIKASAEADDDGGFDIDDFTDFRIGTVIVLLSDDEGVVGEKMVLTGNGFSEDGEWNATIGDITIFDEEDVDEDGILKMGGDTPEFFVPQLMPGTYTLKVWDMDSDISVEVDFEVTYYTTLDLEFYEAPNEFNVSIEGWYWPEVDGDLNDVDDIDFVIYNSSDDWDMDVLQRVTPTTTRTALLNSTGYLVDAWWVIPEDDVLDMGAYTINATIETTNDQEYSMQIAFIIGEVHEDISPRKATFSIGDTVTFIIQHTFGDDPNQDILGGDVKVYDPDDNLYWHGDDLITWTQVQQWYEAPYSSQTAGGNPMVLLDDAPLGEWSYEWRDTDKDTIEEGTFNVKEAPEAILSGQIEDLSTAIDGLQDDISGVEDSVDSVKTDIASAKAAADAAKDAADMAADAISDIAETAGEATTAAEAAKTAAEDAKKAAGGLTTLVYGAIGASLVAALAAIVSLMQISRRIAG